MALTRRSFLRYAGAGLTFGLGSARFLTPGVARAGDALPGEGAAGATAASAGTGAAAGSVGNALRIPALFSGSTIAAATGQQEVWPGTTTDVWTLGGSYPGPTIKVARGQSFAVKFQNGLSEDSIIHWHGLTVPANMDGHPRTAVIGGGSYQYDFSVVQRAGTYWYHPHPDMQTGKQVYKGMAGFFIVTDEAEAALGLPTGQYDIPLLIQDRRVEADHSFAYALTDLERLNGFLGEAVLVNGTPEATLQVTRGLYRFRVLNGSNARVYDLQLGSNRPFWVIGTDGGLLEKPYQVTRTTIAPAERLELLIDFSAFEAGTQVVLKSAQYSGGSGRKQGAPMDIITFDITGNGPPVLLPTTLVDYERLDPNDSVIEREFALRTDESVSPPMHMINGKMFELTRIDEQVTAGDVETWSFLNTTPVPHPMHVHGHQFQVLELNGAPPTEPRDMGWKDTIYLPPYSNAKVLIRFGPYTGVYMVHCHNLEHEDHGMMLNFEVLEKHSGVDEGDRADRMDLW